jgi:hypothetical protein
MFDDDLLRWMSDDEILALWNQGVRARDVLTAKAR